MNLKTAAVLIALTLPLAACGNKGPLVLAPKPSPVVEPAPPVELAAPAVEEVPVTADDAPPGAEPTSSETPPPPPPADPQPEGSAPADTTPNG